jgi:ribose transport system permease protein
MRVAKTPPSSIVDEFVQKIEREQRAARLISWAPVIVLFVLVVLFSSLANKSFPTLGNVVSLLNQLSIILIIALGLTFVTLIGSVDISVDGVVGLAGSVLSVLILNSNNDNDFGMIGVVVAIAIGALVGFLSGTIHVKFKISSFMVTFGMLAVARGFAIMSYRGQFAEIMDPLLMNVPAASFLGIPFISWISFIILGIALVVQEKTPFGRHMYAVGTNEMIPRMTGVNVDSVKIKAYIWSGMCLAIVGIIGALRLGRGDVDIGFGQFFPAQAAVVIGGTSLSGGRGGVLNTFVGALIITVLNNGLLLLGVNTYIRSGVQGLIILVAIGLSVSHSSQTICK